MKTTVRLLGQLLWSYLAVTNVVMAQPTGNKRPLDTSVTPQVAWQAFNDELRSNLTRETPNAFQYVLKSEDFKYDESGLNRLAAKRTQERIVSLFEKQYTISVSVIIWDTFLPDGYTDVVTRSLGAIEYGVCRHPPTNVLDTFDEVIKQPCREGGSIFEVVRSTRFSSNKPALEGSYAAGFQIPKRVMLFYTPRDAWSLVSFPAYDDTVNSMLGSLGPAFDTAVNRCGKDLKARRSSKINASGFAHCISKEFEGHPFEYHTALRGIAVIPEIIPKLPNYSPPGYTSPLGNVFQYPVPLPDYVLRQLPPGEMKLWIYANAPVMVLLSDADSL